jgi:hypothetical protein
MAGWVFSVIQGIIREPMGVFWRCSLNMGSKHGSQTLLSMRSMFSGWFGNISVLR